MREALKCAKKAPESGDVPVGACLIDERGSVVISACNVKEKYQDPTGHAEIEVLRKMAFSRKRWNLSDLSLVVTLEPCTMCAGAILAARIPVVVFGAWDEKFGAVGSKYDLLREPGISAGVEVVAGVLEKECSSLLQNFFFKLRQ